MNLKNMMATIISILLAFITLFSIVTPFINAYLKIVALMKSKKKNELILRKEDFWQTTYIKMTKARYKQLSKYDSEIAYAHVMTEKEIKEWTNQ